MHKLLAFSFLFYSCSESTPKTSINLWNTNISFYQPSQFAFSDSGDFPTDDLPEGRISYVLFKDKMNSELRFSIMNNSEISVDSILKYQVANIQRDIYDAKIINEEIKNINKHKFGYIKFHSGNSIIQSSELLFSQHNLHLIEIVINSRIDSKEYKDEMEKFLSSITIDE